ncbi:DUF445 domain-containing protein [Xylella fastidiosa subsp. fastidiosa]|uniref:DUF445 domain-containing protein n=2 Tax=Xylella fastidiosa TaxID=2371 RepID=Q87DZ4_XYLFT|nr:conserved hypothetical protein [Xylella fastidiosa Temecula1]KAF0571485.1 membrane protein [Xylella fastidiosa subsp. fastidiosa Mus-1]NBI38278.1 DUF445 domain-containing protein [Xylella fastidiosa subsp. fastidiosa]QIS25276.1 DUF445 domain-containing protein [Xylella fastidiosa]RWA34076.1 DUF445 domain-containing protein [Xylella fastidiosa subsp. fastidiosa]
MRIHPLLTYTSPMSGSQSSSPTTDPRLRQLRFMKVMALLLLLIMLGGFILAHTQGNRGIWAWLGAFCEAAMVGALADWFAVVALFKHPMGLPIPHTAILPRNKDRLADGLAHFVRDHFLAPYSLLEKLRLFNPAARLGEWLSTPKQTQALTQMTRDWAIQTLNLLNETTVRNAIEHLVITHLREWNAAITTGDIMALLTTDKRHQRLFDKALLRLARWLDNDKIKAQASALIVRYARREWPTLMGTVNWITSVDEIGDRLAERIARAGLEELQLILTTPKHPLRQQYELWLQDYIHRLRNDPAFIERVEEFKQQAIDNSTIQTYIRDLWTQINTALRTDLESADSTLAGHLEGVLQSLGKALSEDPNLRDKLNEHLLDTSERLSERLRDTVTHHIASTMRGWDEHHLTRQLELNVGCDLQYIRFNGTLVGGLIGLLLHAVIYGCEIYSVMG